MDANELFTQALGLAGQWKVTASTLDVEGRLLSLRLDYEVCSRFACPQCGKSCPTHDSVIKRWRHMDFWQHETTLEARVPRTDCPEHGVLQVAPPWARPGSGFTLMMEAMILLLCQQMPVAAVARHLGETDKRIWRVVDFYVTKAHEAKDWSGVRRVLVDETSTKRGHHYATNFVDADTKDLLFCTEGRKADALGAFAREFARHVAHPAKSPSLSWT
jgi:transposase